MERAVIYFFILFKIYQDKQKRQQNHEIKAMYTKYSKKRGATFFHENVVTEVTVEVKFQQCSPMFQRYHNGNKAKGMDRVSLMESPYTINCKEECQEKEVGLVISIRLFFFSVVFQLVLNLFTISTLSSICLRSIEDQ